MIEVWNLADGVTAVAGAQDPFNVLGRVDDPHASLTYELNGGPPRPVAVNRGPGRWGRLERPGDFSVDTILLADLRPENRLVLRAEAERGPVATCSLRFGVAAPTAQALRSRLDLTDVTHPAEVAQVVEGRWRVGRSPRGEPCLEVRAEDAGYDRIILFGNRGWTTGYEIRTSFRVLRWTDRFHNVGCVFKWNPHDLGDGTHLPTRWTTGLGYYSSNAGLRLRYGVGVHHDADGIKRGDHVLDEQPFSTPRYWAARVHNRLRRNAPPWSQLDCGRSYELRVRADQSLHCLTLWASGDVEPPPQLRVEGPSGKLCSGSVGFIAWNAAVQVDRYDVEPLGAAAGGPARG